MGDINYGNGSLFIQYHKTRPQIFTVAFLLR